MCWRRYYDNLMKMHIQLENWDLVQLFKYAPWSKRDEKKNKIYMRSWIKNFNSTSPDSLTSWIDFPSRFSLIVQMLENFSLQLGFGLVEELVSRKKNLHEWVYKSRSFLLPREEVKFMLLEGEALWWTHFVIWDHVDDYIWWWWWRRRWYALKRTESIFMCKFRLVRIRCF